MLHTGTLKGRMQTERKGKRNEKQIEKNLKKIQKSG